MARRRGGGGRRRHRRVHHHRVHHARPHRTHQTHRRRAVGRRTRIRGNASGGIIIQGADAPAISNGRACMCVIAAVCIFVGIGLTISHIVYFSRFENFTYLIVGIIMAVIGGIMTTVYVCSLMKPLQQGTTRTIVARVQPLTNQVPIPIMNEENPPHAVVYSPNNPQTNQQWDDLPNYLNHTQGLATTTQPIPDYAMASAPMYESATAPPPTYEQAIK